MIFQDDLIVFEMEPNMGAREVFPCTTVLIGPMKYPLMTSWNSTVYQAHFADKTQAFSGPVNKLTFNQLGRREAPNVGIYASTCESVEFTGYIRYASTVFDIVHQLPNVTSVHVHINPTEQLAYVNEPLLKYFFKSGGGKVNSRVTELRIIMDLDYYYTLQNICNGDLCQCRNVAFCVKNIQRSLIALAEYLLRGAAEKFPNLKLLIVALPENERIGNAVRSLIKSSPPGLRTNAQISFKNAVTGKISTEGELRDGKHRFSQYRNESPVYTHVQPRMPFAEQPTTQMSPIYYAENSHTQNTNQQIFMNQPTPTNHTSVRASFLDVKMLNHPPPPGFPSL